MLAFNFFVVYIFKGDFVDYSIRIISNSFGKIIFNFIYKHLTLLKHRN